MMIITPGSRLTAQLGAALLLSTTIACSQKTVINPEPVPTPPVQVQPSQPPVQAQPPQPTVASIVDPTQFDCRSKKEVMLFPKIPSFDGKPKNLGMITHQRNGAELSRRS